MQTGLIVLWGDEHPVLDEVADARLDEHTAVAISRGRFPKPYAHVDPNEDAVLAAAGPDGLLLAVADGHLGFDAARAAIQAVAERAGALVGVVGDASAALQDTCRAARDAVAKAVAGAAPPRSDSRTALTVALAVGSHLHTVTYGDTVCVRGRGGRAKVVSESAPFLGPGSGLVPVTRTRLRDGDRMAVASDGLTTYLGRDWPARTAEVLSEGDAAAAAARRLIELAMDGGAGDHVAVGVAL